MLPTLMTRAGSSAEAAAVSSGKRPGEEERRLHVEVHDAVPALLRERVERLTPRGAGVVDQDVQPVLALADLGGEPGALLDGRQVGRNADDLAYVASSASAAATASACAS